MPPDLFARVLVPPDLAYAFAPWRLSGIGALLALLPVVRIVLEILPTLGDRPWRRFARFSFAFTTLLLLLAEKQELLAGLCYSQRAQSQIRAVAHVQRNSCLAWAQRIEPMS